MKRIIAIDYGDARTGVAVSDLTGTLAGEALTIQEWNAEKLAQRLAFFARERDAEKFVLGLPKNMDGTLGPRAEKAAAFGETLKELTGLPLTLWDERRTTIDAHQILMGAGKNAKKRKKGTSRPFPRFCLQAPDATGSSSYSRACCGNLCRSAFAALELAVIRRQRLRCP